MTACIAGSSTTPEPVDNALKQLKADCDGMQLCHLQIDGACVCHPGAPAKCTRIHKAECFPAEVNSHAKHRALVWTFAKSYAKPQHARTVALIKTVASLDNLDGYRNWYRVLQYSVY